MSKDDFDTLDNAPTIPGEPGGQILSGQYKIIRQIGSGGMGTVYLARDLYLDIEIAIKVLPTLLATNKRAIDNLCGEARTDLKLSHHNIVRLYNFQSDEAIKYLVMEYINGGSLEDKIAADGALSVDETLKIFSQVADALDYAHSQHVLHRDIKPANIMLTKDGVAKLADFGIARQLKESMTHITGKETSGTLLYMAPEQFRGGKPDHHSDIYSLAASIYECLSGKPPFWRGSIEYQIMNVTPEPLNKLSQKQNAALLKALSKEPNDRQESAKELLADLGADSASLNLQPAKKEAKKRYKDTLDYAQTINIKVEKQKVQKNRIRVLAAAVLAIAVIISLMIFVKYRSQNVQQTTDITQVPLPEKPATEPQSPTQTTIPDVQKQVEKTVQDVAKEAEAEKQKKLVEEKEKKLEQDKIEADRKKQEYDKWFAQAQASEKEGNLSNAVMFYQKAEEFTGESFQSKIDSLNVQIAEQEKQKKFNELLAEAKTKDNKEQGRDALKTLDEALGLYSDNSEALALKKKITGYYEPPLAIAPFDAVKAKEYQKAAADFNSIPVEITNSIGMKLVYIPAGQFLMGGPSDEIVSDFDRDESPQHHVKISKGFFIGGYEVTQGQYKAVMDKNPSKFKGDDNLPVEQVNWNDATEFCRKLSQKEGKIYRLPTEAEWEYTCRAGTQTRFSFSGSDSGLNDYGWCSSNSNNHTHPVGQKKPNGFGLYDMHGNVWEWCQDWHGENYYSSSPAFDPQGPTSGKYRVLRGGSWFYPPLYCRSASRFWEEFWFTAIGYYNINGFRVVMEVGP